jgi:hypothetical protein
MSQVPVRPHQVVVPFVLLAFAALLICPLPATAIQILEFDNGDSESPGGGGSCSGASINVHFQVPLFLKQVATIDWGCMGTNIGGLTHTVFNDSIERGIDLTLTFTNPNADEGIVSLNTIEIKFGEDPLAGPAEPATLLLFGTTAAGLGLARWRQRRRGQPKS